MFARSLREPDGRKRQPRASHHHHNDPADAQLPLDELCWLIKSWRRAERGEMTD